MTWAVFLDIDDTLYDFQFTFRKALEKVRRAHAPHVDLSRFADRYQELAFGLPDIWALIHRDVHAYRTRVFEHLRTEFNIDAPAGGLADMLRDTRRDTFEPRPDLDRLLVDLEERATLGVITNGPAPLQREKIRMLGLEARIQGSWILVSGELPWSKPDRRVFQLAQARARLPKQRCIMIGDSPSHDGGAAACGWHFLHVGPLDPWQGIIERVDATMDAATDAGAG